MCLICRRSVIELNVSMTEGIVFSGFSIFTKNVLISNIVLLSIIIASVIIGVIISNVFMTEGIVANIRIVIYSVIFIAIGYIIMDFAMKFVMLRNVIGTVVIVKGNLT